MILSKLSLAYGSTIVLDGIDLQTKGNFSILGANGSGKSTLAKALCGLIPYEGSILIDEQELRGMEPKERAKKIAYIPSKMQSFEQFTSVEEFVLLGRYPYKSSFKDYCDDDKKRVKEILEELNISSLAESNLDALSSGQQQLVLISQALAQESDYIIFDEPTANLDPRNTQLFLQEFKKLRQNHTTVLITHDIQLASHLSDPVLFIKEKAAKFYESGFFEKEFLSLSYDVKFKNENGLIGIEYV